MIKKVIVLGFTPLGYVDYFPSMVQLTKQQFENGEHCNAAIKRAFLEGDLEGWDSKFGMIPVTEGEPFFDKFKDQIEWENIDTILLVSEAK